MLATLATLLCLAIAQSPPADGYRKALASAQRDVQTIKEFIALFPKASHRITYYTGEAGKPRWSSTVGLFNRYILRLEFHITFDQTRTSITKHDPPQFHLIELDKITYDPKARTEQLEHGPAQVSFGPREWQKIVQAKGNLEVLGLKIKQNKPVAGFDQYFQRNFGE